MDFGKKKQNIGNNNTKIWSMIITNLKKCLEKNLENKNGNKGTED